MVKAILTATAATLVAGCTVVDKHDRYFEVESRFINPDQVEVYYKRRGERIEGYERRCFGKDCELPGE